MTGTIQTSFQYQWKIKARKIKDQPENRPRSYIAFDRGCSIYIAELLNPITVIVTRRSNVSQTRTTEFKYASLHNIHSGSRKIAKVNNSLTSGRET